MAAKRKPHGVISSAESKVVGYSRPAADEIEVSIFGPGRGEAIAIHLGNGTWITIDSCKQRQTGHNALLGYFQEIGVDVAKDVHRVIATHAHDDHIAGISDLFIEAKSSRFVLSAAATSDEFYADVAADATIEKQLRQKIRGEYRAVRNEARARYESDKKAPNPVMEANESRILYSEVDSDGTRTVLVQALSPSDTARERARLLLAQGSAKEGQRRRLSAGDPNEFAVAVWVEVGNVSILLGGDLLTGPDGCGWKAVLNSHSFTHRASIFKVPHHGSETSHLDGVWSELLTKDAIAIMAPYRAGRTPIPKPSDISRIAGLAGSVYITAPPALPKQTDSVRKKAATFSTIGARNVRNVRDPDGRIGHVRARRKVESLSWSVNYFDPAEKLS